MQNIANIHPLKKAVCWALCVLSFNLTAKNVKPNCHPTIDSTSPQYLVSYGSLISETSKKKTGPKTGKNRPIELTGFQRGWFLKGRAIGFSTTFLGVKVNRDAKINAVVFNLADPNEIQAFDTRESGYCRYLINDSAINFLAQKIRPKAQYWIYVPQKHKIADPTSEFPIVQSYVDLFLSGCLQVEKKYHLQGYAKACIQTTSDWSRHWVNDRIYPQRPWVYEPNALEIDKMLSNEIPDQFSRIKIQ